MTRAHALVRAIVANRWVDIRDAARAQVALIAALRKQRARPVGELVDAYRIRPEIVALSPDQISRAIGLADSVDRAARYGVFRPQCLARAIALSAMLDTNGIGGHRIRVGVRKTGADFGAHAWVELGDMALGDDTVDVDTYVPLTNVAFTLRSAGHGSTATARGS